MQLTLRGKWTDSRLLWNPLPTGPVGAKTEKELEGVTNIVMSRADEAKDLIWRPDVRIQRGCFAFQ
jgi:hypothetical protein